MALTIKWKKLSARAEIPSYGSPDAACFDFRALLDAPLTLEPGVVTAIPTGLAVELPKGFELQLRARSGLAYKHGLSLVNGIGTIDADYRGEIKVIVIVHGKEPLTLQSGDRIAQGLVAPVLALNFVEVEDMSSTERGVQGFGSTGVH